MSAVRLAAFGILWTLVTQATAETEVNTTLSDSFTQPVHVHEGEDALLTCVVRNPPSSATVIWKREDEKSRQNVILTSGDTRVATDNRISILHDRDGDVWVLVIKKVRTSDAGLYTCEVNTQPVLRSFHKLVVLPLSIQPPNVTISSSDSYSNYDMGTGVFPAIAAHNYVACCSAKNVTKKCFGFCSLVTILEGTTGQEPEACENDFPNIVSCMADGRNHIPCCIREGVPDLCQDLCRGDYTRITDSIKSHYSCAAYTERTLACIADGVVILPGPPTAVEVESPTETMLLVQWQPPHQNGASVTEYVVNVTQLRPVDDSLSADDDGEEEFLNATATRVQSKTIEVKIQAPGNSSLVEKLTPFTMYEVSVTAYNVHGSSLPSVRLRTITMPQGEYRLPPAAPPKLPDVRTCCINEGVAHETCIEKLCDPRLADLTDVTDLMICAPWANQTFSCLTDGRDHTACCQERGLPELCLDFCAANFTKLDYRHFRCLRYIRDYGSCLLQGYGVLPSAPLEIQPMKVETDLAILTWSPPEHLGATVKGYSLHYRSLPSDQDAYKLLRSTHPPYLLVDLMPDTDYEVYVEGENEHGAGAPSSRLLFRTMSLVEEEAEEESEEEEEGSYNVTSCCLTVRLRKECMPLCDYDAKMSDVRALALTCSGEFPKLLRCGAGGRNHTACCKRRGVHTACESLCAGIVSQPLLVLATTCSAFIGNIVQCFEEGTGLLPGPVNELQATMITDGSVTLLWEPPDDSTPKGYEVHYRLVDLGAPTPTPASEDAPIVPLQEMVMNVSSPPVEVKNLAVGSLYQFSVVTVNEHGSSLPSSVLLLNISSAAFNGSTIDGLPSSPHSLVVSSHSATWVSITWQPPEVSHHFESFVYMVHNKAMADPDFTVKETSVTSLLLDDLKPNTQHVVFVTAKNSKGESSPSETLIAWTDPAYPAFVEPPTIRPLSLVMEGGSMTVLCIAMGLPLPTVSLYVSGRLVRQERTRHMVTVIHNVTREMDHVSCYADNGYGTPMQASRRIAISHRPYINASGVTMAAVGDNVMLQCRVEAHPEPSMVFWRDQGGRVPIIHGGRFSVDNHPAAEPGHYLMQLTISSIQEDDAGSYFCHAVNAFGTYTQTITIRIRKLVGPSANISQCCAEQNVSIACLDACDLDLDVETVLDKPECIPDFNKLVRCAADGSDHRSCCSQWGVPRRCLDWCRGDPVQNSKLCGLSFTKHIVHCFQEGKERLPGPPLNVQVEVLDSQSVLVKWDPPAKNPHTVDLYRVLWRPIGVKQAQKNETKETHLMIVGLKESTPYECVVKAGNHYGTSVHTEPLQFVTLPKYITSASTGDGSSPQVGVAVAVVLALVLAVLGGGVWFLRRRRLLSLKTAGGVAFENPSYLREMNAAAIAADAAQSQQGGSTEAAVSNGRGQSNGWQQETLHGSSGTEVPPTLYEELRLGQEGAGFKRLKP